MADKTMLSGANIPAPIISNKNWLRLHFVTESNHRHKGFRAQYQVKTCGSNLQGPSGTFMSPNFPIQYESNSQCVWIITGSDPNKGPSGTFMSPNFPIQYESNSQCVWIITGSDPNKVIQINFEDFDLEIGYDSLTIGDGAEVGDSKTPMEPTLSSDWRWSHIWWDRLTIRSGTKLPVNLQARPRPQRDPNGRMNHLAFTLKFQTELSYDFLEVHDGPNLLSPLIGSFNGTQVPQFLFSSGNFLYLLFTTDNSRSNSGFKIFYEVWCVRAQSPCQPRAGGLLLNLQQLTKHDNNAPNFFVAQETGEHQ
ncbi:hypothetical protein CRUP_008189 [Coryphaenoides rupestris]|nr:hypothetical protein CRUP_008189 [Coryphaenoides rupestris]